jgi:putative DNA primase/helicase
MTEPNQGSRAPRVNVDELKSRISIDALISATGVELKRQGNEYKGLCPFHDEKTPSFTVTPEKGYYCFGCDAKGDHLDFLQDRYGLDFKQAVDKLQEFVGEGIVTGETAAPRASNRKSKPADKWQHQPCPDDVRPPETLRTKRGDNWTDAPVVTAWPYRDRAGTLHGYTCRIEPEPDKKEIIPVCWMVSTETGEGQLRQKSLQEPRLLYGTELLDQHPKSNVILVEGEKAADAARRLTAELPVIVLSWPGGCKAVSKADWSLLAGRKIVGWPDTDSQVDKRTGLTRPYHKQPGMAAMLEISEHVSRHGGQMRIVAVPYPGHLEDGWDAADAEAEGWTGADVMAHIKSNIRTPEEIRKLPGAEPSDNPEPEPEPEPEPAPAKPSAPEPMDIKPPFRCLGIDEGHYYYLPVSTQQVTAISAGTHTNKSYLLSIAPLWWYEMRFPSKQGADWTEATDQLMRWSEEKGTFDAARVRGRGAWFDAGKSILHLGDRLLVNGEETDLTDHKTRFIYEKKPALEALKPEGHLDEDDAILLHAICGMLNWQKPVNATLFAGWLVLAPICGALQWRPHAWLTGQRGTGKSWVFDNIVGPVLGASSLTVQSTSTEAGIRQRLKQDARSVVFDEAEGENQTARKRMQAVLELARQASSDSLAEIAKGTAGGKAMSFKIRSMFLMGSINVGLAQASDKSRFTVLSLTKPKPGAGGREQFEALEESVNNTLTKKYCAALRSRTYQLIPVIRESARVFAKVAAEHIGNQRAGDQLGALLAGAWSLRSSEAVTLAEAREYVTGQDWGMDGDESADSDEVMLIQELLQAQVRLDTEKGNKVRSISELVQKFDPRATVTDYEVTVEDAAFALARHGVKVNDGWLIVSESHQEIRKILRDTPWAGGWGRILERIQGAEQKPAIRFAGVRNRAIQIPLVEIM